MIIDIEDKKGFVFDTEKPIKDFPELFVIYFSEKRAFELGLSDAEIKKIKEEHKQYVAQYKDGMVIKVTEERY